MPCCSAPVTARSSRPRTVSSIIRIYARGRCRACVARRSGARRRSRNACGVRDGWPRLASGGPVPAVEVDAPQAVAKIERPKTVRYDFDSERLPADFQWLRTPLPQRIFSLSERPGALRLIGRESIGSWFEQALVARRQEHFSLRVETELDFAPQTFQQAAGLTHYYNRHKFHLLAVSHDARHGRVLTIMSCPGNWPDLQPGVPARRGSCFAGARNHRPCRRDRRSPIAVLLSHHRRMAAGRTGPRRQCDLGRGRPRRACLVHRRLHRHGRFRHQRRGDAGRFSRFPI